jgi:hypothetical protein
MAMTAAQKKAFVARMEAGRARAAEGKSSTEIIVAPRSAPAGKTTVKYMAPPPKAAPKSLARRVGSAAVVVAVQEKEMIASLLTAGAIGYLDQEGWLNELPEPESVPIGKKGVLAILAYAGARYLVKDAELKKILMGVSTAAGTIAMYELVKGWTAKKQMEKITGLSGAGDGESSAGV